MMTAMTTTSDGSLFLALICFVVLVGAGEEGG
jgi:hypothetical protein